MAGVEKFSEGLIDVAERFADVVDAAQGRGARKASGFAKWLVLPAAGAAAYGLATSRSGLARQTRKLMSRAKDRATELPDADLFGRVKEVAGAGQSSSGNSGGTQRASASRPRRTAKTQRRRKTASTR